MKQLAEKSEIIVSSAKSIDNLGRELSEDAQTVSAATEQQAATVDNITVYSEQLAKLAQELQNLVNVFTV